MTGHVLGDIALRQIKTLWDDYQKRSIQPAPRMGRVHQFHVALTDGSGISAASGSTPGSGTVTLQRLVSGALANRTDSTGAAVTKTVYNFVETASAASAYVFVAEDAAGTLWLVAEACS